MKVCHESNPHVNYLEWTIWLLNKVCIVQMCDVTMIKCYYPNTHVCMFGTDLSLIMKMLDYSLLQIHIQIQQRACWDWNMLFSYLTLLLNAKTVISWVQ